LEAGSTAAIVASEKTHAGKFCLFASYAIGSLAF